MEKISIRNLGPITEADITFGDLTILVGPQASGKSILLQMVKLMADAGIICMRLESSGYVWEDMSGFLKLFLGEGMEQIWTKSTSISVDDKVVNPKSLLSTERKNHQNVFYIPAQRIVALQNGWLRPFSDLPYESYIVRGFSDALISAMERTPSTLIGNKNKAGDESLQKAVYYNGKISVDVINQRKTFVLNFNKANIPFASWSAGQKEFMPLLLGMNILFHPKPPYDKLKIAIVEEPEMGLHPAAIKQVIVSLLKLVQMGYKVIISTHSPVFIEFAWAFKILQEEKASAQALIDMFEVNKDDLPQDFFTDILTKSLRTYYFDRKENGVVVKDISSLDAGSEDTDISEWGGLSSFASKASEVVAKNVAL